MDLRGFDSYEVTLGDEMRGERASRGKTLEDAERELRIKSDMLVGIEDCDLSAFRNQSVIPGYVRSYARYLKMDPDDCYRRFCEVTGYQSPSASLLGSGAASGGAVLSSGRGHTGSQLEQSRFAAPPGRNRFRARVSLGAVTSALALLGLIAGLGYGGYSLLQDIQRVAIAPLPQAPVVVAEAPTIAAPGSTADGLARPSASDYASDGALGGYSRPSSLPAARLRRRDGPISAIDPAKAGTFAPVQPKAAPAPVATAAPEAGGDTETTLAIVPPIALVTEQPKPGVPPVPKRRVQLGIVIHAAAKAWIKISDRNDVTVWQGTLQAGKRYRLPRNVVAPMMRTGNAGMTYVMIDGEVYGPLGSKGRIAKGVSLSVDRIRAALPRAEAKVLTARHGSTPSQSADARGKRP